MTRVVKEGYIYDQAYRGSASRGLQSPFLPVPLTGAHRFLPIITRDFSPGSSRPGGTRAPAAGVVKEDKLCDQGRQRRCFFRFKNPLLLRNCQNKPIFMSLFCVFPCI